MTMYKTPTLSSKTPEAEQTKLVAALKAVSGVQSATLHLSTHEFEIKGADKKEPKREDVTAAASKAGFSVSKN